MLVKEQDKIPPEIDQQLSSAAVPPKLKMSPPRSLWLEFVLNFCTFGLYAGVWMVLRMREFTKLTNINITPWLWFFSTHIPLVQIFSYPKFFRIVRQIELAHGIPLTRRWSTLWIAITIIFTIAVSASKEVEYSDGAGFAIIFFWAGLFSVLQLPVNRIKRSLDNVEFTPRKRGYSIIEWLVVIPMLPLMIWLIFEVSVSPNLIDKIKTYPSGEHYLNKELGLKVPFYGKGWTQVAVGTFSDDADKEDIVAEFKLPLTNSYFILWKLDSDTDLTYVSRYRQQQFLLDFPEANCSQMRKFSKNAQSINVYTRCYYFGALSNYNQFSTLIKSKNLYYELSGYFHTTQEEYDRYLRAIRQTADGFETIL